MQRMIRVALLTLAMAGTAFGGCDDVIVLACPTTGMADALTTTDCPASDGSRFDRFQFSGAVGQTVTIQMTSSAFDTLLLLLDPSENPVAVNDDASRSVTDSQLIFTLTSSGTWTIVANSLSPAGAGDYFISASLDCPVVSAGPKRRAVRR